MGIFDFFSKAKKESKEVLDKGMEKTKEGFFSKLTRSLVGKSRIDDEYLDELEEILISSDVGVETTLKIIERLEKRIERDKYINASELHTILKSEIKELLAENDNAHVNFQFGENVPKPYVIMVVGVNGVGKTTTIGKLSNRFKNNGLKVMLGAADTFRAAAVDQLKIWAGRTNVDITYKDMGTDPAAVAYAAVQEAVNQNTDVCIVDTAGRLHNKVNLMNELTKIKRVMTKVIPDAPHEILLVLDGSTGQNAFEQAKQFSEATEINALAITKLDGTAKGGVVIGISDQLKVPVKYIGVGEGVDDLQLFDKETFIDSLFN
ncbi:MAG TPA: signal recognition particle-docking protein FtsY [Crocinitomicaceae bacterium]|nr:signal recognition particle-docking protein FtsY [Crocinitomicaceae bacterium]